MPANCMKLREAMRRAGFKEEDILFLAENQNLLHKPFEQLLRSIRNAQEDKADFLSEASTFNGGSMSCPFVSSRFDFEEWGSYIMERNNRSNTQYAIQNMHGVHFVPLGVNSAELLLIPSNEQFSTMDDVLEEAEKQRKGCTETTHPILVFDALRLLWEDIDRLEANYILIPFLVERKPPAENGYPIIINTQKRKAVGITSRPPHKDLKGYYAFCCVNNS